MSSSLLSTTWLHNIFGFIYLHTIWQLGNGKMAGLDTDKHSTSNNLKLSHEKHFGNVLHQE